MTDWLMCELILLVSALERDFIGFYQFFTARNLNAAQRVCSHILIRFIGAKSVGDGTSLDSLLILVPHIAARSDPDIWRNFALRRGLLRQNTAVFVLNLSQGALAPWWLKLASRMCRWQTQPWVPRQGLQLANAWIAAPRQRSFLHRT